jgi:hypothetical protein
MQKSYVFHNLLLIFIIILQPVVGVFIIGVGKMKKGSIGLVRFPPRGGEGWGLGDYLMTSKPLPATSHPIAPLPREGIKR